MDNKRWGKRFSTIFWWSLTILPLVVCLIQFIGYHLAFNSGISTADELAAYHNNTNGDFYTILSWYLNPSNAKFSNITINALRNCFQEMGYRLGISTPVLGCLLGYMASVQLYHLMFDFIAWLPRLFHSWMDRWCVE